MSDLIFQLCTDCAKYYTQCNEILLFIFRNPRNSFVTCYRIFCEILESVSNFISCAKYMQTIVYISSAVKYNFMFEHASKINFN